MVGCDCCVQTSLYLELPWRQPFKEVFLEQMELSYLPFSENAFLSSKIKVSRYRSSTGIVIVIVWVKFGNCWLIESATSIEKGRPTLWGLGLCLVQVISVKQVLVNSSGHGLRVLGQGNRPVHSWSKDQLQL